MRKQSLIFVVGYTTYFITEFCWRGETPHYSMALVGGTVLLFINHFVYEKYKSTKLLPACLYSSIIITFIEFIAGVILNLTMKLNIWGYKSFHLNVLGQIAIIYTVLWFFISIPAITFCKAINDSEFLSDNKNTLSFNRINSF